MNFNDSVLLIVLVLAIIYLIHRTVNVSAPKLDGFADRINEPSGPFASGGGTYMDDIPYATDTIYGGKQGKNEFVAGCCTMQNNSNGGCARCALSVNESGSVSSGINVADNGSKLDFADFGYEPNSIKNAVKNDRSTLSPTLYQNGGTNLVPAGDPYMPPYSQYNPPLF